MTEIKPTNCHFCGYCCAFLATVEDGRVVDLKPDPTRYPYDERILAGCRRWRMNLDVLDSPRRVNYPLRRVGERGSGEWERVSWSEALDDIASRLSALREEYGAGTLASMIGGPHASFWPLHRFMNLFGSPNNMGIGQICWNPRIWMDAVTFGWTGEADIEFGVTDALFIWGTNPAQSDNSAFWQTVRRAGADDSMELVCVDPCFTQAAGCADLWLALRPGTDCTLALGMLHVIIGEGLEDRAFVEDWCHGFDELAEHVKPFTPEYVGEFCGVRPEDIVRAARLFAAGRTALVSGRGIDQVGKSVAPAHRVICCLRAVTGNVDRPGTFILNDASDFVSEVDFELSPEHEEELRPLCLNEGIAPLQCFSGYDLVNEQTSKLGRSLPMRYMTSSSPHLVLHAMETGEPYRVSALIVNATNPLLTYADTNRLFKALMGLELIVVLDYYITPTGAVADYVLPCAGAIERPIFQIHGGVANFGYGGPAAVRPYYERKTDYDIFRSLGQRLGQGEAWPDESLEEAFATQLAPTGWDWEAYCFYGAYSMPSVPEKHLLPGPDGKPQGFATTTGKIELASELLPRLGGEALPEQGPFMRLCSPALVERLEAQGAHHVEMLTGCRKQPYNASMYLENSKFRKAVPGPVVEMSQKTADDFGLQAGDVALLTTDKGEARFNVAIAKMRDDLISVDYGWWHPEDGVPQAPDFGGIWESNVNVLTSCELQEPLIGTWAYNAIDCMIQKDDAALSW